jgi:hypothetical protein
MLTLPYALSERRGNADRLGLVCLAITFLMIIGSIGDNLIIAHKMRKLVPWGSILFAFAAGIIASIFFTPLIGLVSCQWAVLAENQRLKNAGAIASTKAYMIGWGWAFGFGSGRSGNDRLRMLWGVI